MTTGPQRRRRLQRGIALELPPGQWRRNLEQLRSADALIRLAWCAAAAAVLILITRGWAPPLAYRTRYTPPRNLVARIEFEVPNPRATEQARERARREVVSVYRNDPQPLIELQQALIDKVFQITAAASYEQVDKKVWGEFLPRDVVDANDEAYQRLSFEKFHAALLHDDNVSRLKEAVERAFQDFRRNGLLENLEHELDQGSQTELSVYQVGVERNFSNLRRLDVRQVRIAEVRDQLLKRLSDELEAVQIGNDPVEVEAQLPLRLYTWARPQLPRTLTWDRPATLHAADAAAAAVETVMTIYQRGDRLEGIEGGRPLTANDLLLLRQEHEAVVAGLSFGDLLLWLTANLGMYGALYILCGAYLSVRQPRLLSDLRQFLTLLAAVVATVGLVVLAARDAWRVELIPLLLLALTLTIAHRHETALLISGSVSLAATIALGQGLGEFVIYLAAMAAAILLVGRVRTRTRLIFVGLGAALVAAATTLGVGTLVGQPLMHTLLPDAAWYGFCAIVAGIVATGLLPFIERIFDVQTDISLLELGDAAHPLLQELVRRAPGTYNHSINVASIAEAAAEAIHANGLLVRVGAYFHDIGKMLKPGYFVENQGQGGNRHESLLPAMSTLVIIAHVKDGADLAQQHHLPQSIIDFIEQHHGTTLVEYFYREAAKQREANPDAAAVDETSFRYPGPKPQTKEAAVLMLADAVESACRALVDPTPARIHSLVHDLAMKRLLDGQFDDCELTLQELRVIQVSLVKSLTAVYHGRVKYPDQQSAGRTA